MWMYLKISSQASRAAGGWQQLPQSLPQALSKAVTAPVLFALLFAAQLTEQQVYPAPPEASGLGEDLF